MILFTIGYQRHTISTLLVALQTASVEQVLDVRAVALSSRSDFCRDQLRETLFANGIRYEHVEAAGNPFRDDALPMVEILEKYRAEIAKGGIRNPAVVAVGKAIVGNRKRTALLCGCADPALCHRSIVAAHVRPHLKPLGSWTVEHIASPVRKKVETQLSLLGGGR